MSKENLEQFMKQVVDSEDLQSRMGDEIAGDDLGALGTEPGWEFSAEDLQPAAESSDEELDAVAGGFDIGPVGRRLRLRPARSGLAMQGGRFRFIVEPQF